MAKIASKNSEVYFSTNDTPTKLTACRSWSMNTEIGTIDVGTIGTEWKEFLVGQKSVSGDFEVLYDNDTVSANATLETAMMAGTPIIIFCYPEGKVSGKAEYQINAYITSWNISAATEDAITIAVSYQGTGAITKGTVTA